MPVEARQAVKQAISWKHRLRQPAALALCLALVLWLGWSGVYGKNGLLAWMDKRAEEQKLRLEIDQLNQENARLRDRIERLQSNPDAIGQVAREQLHYVKPNEVIVQLPPEKQKSVPSAGAGK
jgi:cell division protein FtsB